TGAGVGGTHGALEVLDAACGELGCDVILTGPVQLNGATVNVASLAQLELNGSVTDHNFFPHPPLIKTGAGTLKLGGSAKNTYSGSTLVNEGTLLLAKSSGATAVPGDVVVGDDTTATTTATLRTLRDQQFSTAAKINVRKSGLLDLIPSPGAPAPSPTV